MTKPHVGLWFCPNRKCKSRGATLEESLVERPYHGLRSEGAKPVRCRHCRSPLDLVRIRVTMSEEAKQRLRELARKKKEVAS